MPDPIYTSSNCGNVAYQLNWTYTVFWKRDPPCVECWKELQKLCEPDGIRLLRHELTSPRLSQFLVSTRPGVIPQVLVQRIKGRYQHLLRVLMPNAFQRNYALRSIGSADRTSVETYIEGQLNHHRLNDLRTEELFSKHQFQDSRIDLSIASQNSHSVYWYNLHVVLVNAERFRIGDEKRLALMLGMVRRVARKKGHLLSRFGLLPDHMHLLLRANLSQSPESVVLSYMNNLAYSLGMRPIFQYSYYVGTIGEYTNKAVPRN